MYSQHKLRRAVIECMGVVQGVGFRPFIYRLAVKRDLRGYVRNLGDASVRIVVEGEESKITEFIKDLVKNKPYLVRYERINYEFKPYLGEFKEFEIKESSRAKGRGSSYIPPDTALCPQCRKELFNPRNRRYRYPFIVCSECGPRFTILEELPYDRERTSMREFPMCNECKREYLNPLDRRFHAEPICCPKCGPSMKLYGANGEIIDVSDPILEAAKLIMEGYILAVKGIGGIHIAAKTTDDQIVLKLRERRKKPNKPLAIMAKDIKAVEKFAFISDVERELLLSYRRPIVTLKKKEPFILSKWISPNLHTVGVMLPYSGIHELLLSYVNEPALIMTSGNYPNQPMIKENKEAFKQLSKIADYFLLHNRKIVNRNDDSVIRVVDGKLALIRRSRGYVPEPIRLSFLKNPLNIIALGAMEKVTGAILKNNYCYLTQHIGDVDNLSTLFFLKNAVEFMMKITSVEKVNAFACDLHPSFMTSRLGKELAEAIKVPLIQTQHHHAHIASVMAENNLPIDEEVIGIAIDGFGFGVDGTAWGGEILIVKYDSFERFGHLQLHSMPGGDLCVVYPARMALSILSEVMSEEELVEFANKRLIKGFKYGLREIEFVIEQLKKKINLVYTSSAGRVLDAVSAILGVCFKRTYDSEPAMVLESFSINGDEDAFRLPVEIESNGGNVTLKTSEFFNFLVNNLNNAKLPDLGASLHKAMARGLAEIALEASEKTGIKKVAISGGVCYNELIMRNVRKIIERHGLILYKNVNVPPGDGGISLGQAVIAYAKLLSGDIPT